MTGNLLRDLLPDAPREAGLLVAAVGVGLPAALRSYAAQGVEPATAVQLAAASLADRTAFTPDACLWAAAELAITCGLTGAGELPVVMPPAGTPLGPLEAGAPPGPAATENLTAAISGHGSGADGRDEALPARLRGEGPLMLAACAAPSPGTSSWPRTRDCQGTTRLQPPGRKIHASCPLVPWRHPGELPRVYQLPHRFHRRHHPPPPLPRRTALLPRTRNRHGHCANVLPGGLDHSQDRRQVEVRLLTTSHGPPRPAAIRSPGPARGHRACPAIRSSSRVTSAGPFRPASRRQLPQEMPGGYAAISPGPAPALLAPDLKIPAPAAFPEADRAHDAPRHRTCACPETMICTLSP